MQNEVGYDLRPLTPSDQPFLWEMLYQSLYVSEGTEPFERSIINDPEIAKYVKGWGRENDAGFIAVDEDGRPLGAIWMRLFKGEERGYGYVDEQTPEIGMAVLPKYRGRGLGTKLLSQLLKSAEGVYEHLSLSVAAENPALRLYKRKGFEVVREEGSSVIMKRKMLSRRFHGAT